METRLLIAYSMIAAFVFGGALLLWIFVVREKLARRGRRIRFRRQRKLSPHPPIDRARDAFEAD